MDFEAHAVEVRNAATTHPRWYRDRTLLTIVAAQVLWFWWAFSRGWFLQADLSNLADGAGRSLTWGYLSEPLGGHFGPVPRLLYWLVDQLGTLNYTSGVLIRVACQAISTVLLFRILVILVGRRPLVLAIVAIYAINPLLLAGGAWFTSGMGLVPGQALALFAIATYLRYELTRQLRFAAYAGVLLALTVLTGDQWVVVALVPPMLSFTYFYGGGLRDRLRETWQQWRAWLLTFTPLLAALVAILTFGKPTGSSTLSFAEGYRLLRESWLKTIGTSWVGGPWHWISGPGIYVSFSGPPDWVVLLGQLGVFVTVALGVQRIGLRSLVAWIMPVVCTAVGVVIVGIGRYSTYGAAIAITPRYLFEAVALFAIGAALALAPTAARQNTTSLGTPALDSMQRWIGGAALAGLLVMCLISGARFAVPLGRSPVHNYVTNLEASTRSYGSKVNIWDTPVPQDVISSYEPRHRVSDILRLANVPATFDDPASAPLLVNSDGHLTKATFIAAAVGESPAGACGTFVHGKGTWTVPLTHPVHAAEWFLHIDLYQSEPSDVTIEVVNYNAGIARPIRGSRQHLETLEALNIPLPLFAPAAVRVHSASSATNLCLAHVAIGGPFAVGGS